MLKLPQLLLPTSRLWLPGMAVNPLGQLGVGSICCEDTGTNCHSLTITCPDNPVPRYITVLIHGVEYLLESFESGSLLASQLVEATRHPVTDLILTKPCSDPPGSSQYAIWSIACECVWSGAIIAYSCLWGAVVDGMAIIFWLLEIYECEEGPIVVSGITAADPYGWAMWYIRAYTEDEPPYCDYYDQFPNSCQEALNFTYPFKCSSPTMPGGLPDSPGSGVVQPTTCTACIESKALGEYAVTFYGLSNGAGYALAGTYIVKKVPLATCDYRYEFLVPPSCGTSYDVEALLLRQVYMGGEYYWEAAFALSGGTAAWISRTLHSPSPLDCLEPDAQTHPDLNDIAGGHVFNCDNWDDTSEDEWGYSITKA